jgi:uncharacterized membrane protein (DUF2068 family)
MRSTFWSGWVGFAGLLMVILGVLDIIQGIAAVVDEKYYTLTNSGVIIFDLRKWGWIMIVWGVLLAAAGFGLLAKKAWARWLTIVGATLNIVGQVSFLALYPGWVIVTVGLNAMVLYAITVQWRDVEAVD